MDVELQSIEILTQKKVKLTIVTTHFCSYYTYFTSIRKFSSLNAVSYSPLKQQIAAVIKNKFFASHVLDSVNVWKVPVKSLKHRFNNARCIRKILSIRSFKEQFYTFKIVNSNWLNYANSRMKALFPYNCKNIFDHLSKKTNLLFRLENKTRFSAWKMLQTTTI
jgi:hypothetical protein